MEEAVWSIASTLASKLPQTRWSLDLMPLGFGYYHF